MVFVFHAINMSLAYRKEKINQYHIIKKTPQVTSLVEGR
jgi:hypothetical protein